MLELVLVIVVVGGGLAHQGNGRRGRLVYYPLVMNCCFRWERQICSKSKATYALTYKYEVEIERRVVCSYSVAILRDQVIIL